MTVTSTSNRQQDNGNGATVDFSFSFKVFAKEDLKVYKVNTTTGVSTLQTITTDYTVALNTSTEGGTVTFVVAPTATEQSLILRELDLDQQLEIPTASNLPEQSFEDAYDKSIMVAQQLQEQINRSLVQDVGSTVTGVNIPAPVANKALVWNTAANDLENSIDDYDDQAANAAASAVTASTAARNASTSETNAANSAIAAAASAASNNIAAPTASKHGAILYQNDADDGYIGLTTQGTAGQFLQSNGADAAPSFEDNVSTWALLSTQTASASTSIDFTSGIDSTYKKYVIEIIEAVSNTDGDNFGFRASTDGGSTFLVGTNYRFAGVSVISSGTTVSGDASNGAASLLITNTSQTAGNVAGESFSSIIEISNPSSATLFKNVKFHSSYQNTSANATVYTGAGAVQTTTAIDAFRIRCNNLIASGTFKLYGIN